MSDGTLVLVVTTAPSVEVAERLVEGLVEARLVACGNLLSGVTSLYRWEGRVARESEVLVVLKTVRSRVDDVFRRLAETHPYEVPELVAVTGEEASHAYRQWVRRETIEVSA